MTDYPVDLQSFLLAEQKRIARWMKVLKISNVVLSVLYVLYAWIFTVVGIYVIILGIPANISSVLFLLTPVFCVLGILFSVLLRRKNRFAASFLIQFLPFGVLGIAFISFFLSIVGTW